LLSSNPPLGGSAARTMIAGWVRAMLCYRTANMAKKEGVRRIVMTGKLIVLIGITLGVLSVVSMFGRQDMFFSPAILIGGSIALRVGALGGLVWAAGWIGEGFTQPDP
jgi:hypothetical protein